ncbi:RNA polymerase sigma factor [Aurantibacillus circumpalustris]|uniref:RNA polymerase sigma factor n=1 Tax=Aurantibacillus circumpalustris TaxID=3036359 RepID=UPI00295BF939|nr:RNA polymerase sigma factor [Aurantibacillus circumpalustris]
MTIKEIYDKHSKQVFNLALHYAQNTEDAEEITQDVFVAIHQSLHVFQEKSQLGTWIYRITVNKSLDFIKARNRKKRFAFITSLFTTDSEKELHNRPNFDHPGMLLEQKESLKILFNHINDLPVNQKTALILSKIEQQSQKEIAQIMNISPKAAESLIQRAKKNLSKKINRREGN